MEHLPSNLEQSVAAFCEHVAALASSHGVEFVLDPASHTPYPSTGDLVNGYVVEFPQPKLAVAVGKPVELWLPILVHESCHLDQLLAGTAVWEKARLPGTTIETIDLVSLWIDGKIELSESQLDEYIRCSRNVELDCERRTVEKIEAFGLPIDVPEYIQKANSYIFFYTAMKETKSWYSPDGEPYNVEHVWSLCPKKFLADEEYEKVPAELMSAYRNLL